MSGQQKAAAAIDRHIDRRIQRSNGRKQVAIVKQLTPLILDPIDLNYNLHESDITFTQSVEKYQSKYGLERGDNVIIERISGSWYVMDVVSENPQTDPPPGGGGSDAHATIYISSPVTPWPIPHGLGKKPAIQIYDTSHRLVLCEIEHTDDNNAVAKPGRPMSGYAECN